MQRDEVIHKLKNYFLSEVLESEDTRLDETTPLLEWGILNSFEMIRLFHYINSEFGLDIPPEKMMADHFKNMLTITDLICNRLEN